MGKENKILVAVLRPEEDQLEFVEINRSETLSFLQETTGGYVDLVRLGDIDLWVNDEFLFNKTQFNFNIVSRKQLRITHAIYGNVVFASYDNMGNTAGLTEEQIHKINKMMFKRRALLSD